MSTILLECGCSVSRSMYGERKIINIIFCEKHSTEDIAKLIGGNK